jgi:hypothetical protein
MMKFSRNETPDSLINGTIGAEVGVDQGEFSSILLSKNPSKLYLVDAWKTIEGTDRTTGAEQSIHDEKYLAVSNKFNDDPRVEIIREWSEAAASGFDDNSLDWVYIDARHDYTGVMSDLRAWQNKVKSTGFIWGDDYRTPDMKHKPRVEVRQAVADFTKQTHWELVGLTTEEKRSKSFFLAKDKEVIDRFKSL